MFVIGPHQLLLKGKNLQLEYSWNFVIQTDLTTGTHFAGMEINDLLLKPDC